MARSASRQGEPRDGGGGGDGGGDGGVVDGMLGAWFVKRR